MIRIERLILTILAMLVISIYGCDQTQEEKLFYKEAGKGETILFIHGTQEDYRVFIPQLEALKDKYHVVIYSRRFNYPHPKNYQQGDTYDPFTEAEDLESLINELKTNNIHLVGHSYGGLIALAYTHRNSDKVKSLALSEPPMLRLPGCESWYQVAQKDLIESVASAFDTNDTTLVMKAVFEFFAGADVQDQVPPEILQSLKANLTEMKALVNSDDPFPDLNTNLKLPVMILTSGNTMQMLDCTNSVLVEQMPEAKHVHISNATHDMWMTHPDLLSQYVQEFISGDMDDVRIEN
jgi:pimeloyl-ACP methyl ester carboxylesterase